jgi:hypothetical protein
MVVQHHDEPLPETAVRLPVKGAGRFRDQS